MNTICPHLFIIKSLLKSLPAHFDIIYWTLDICRHRDFSAVAEYPGDRKRWPLTQKMTYIKRSVSNDMEIQIFITTSPSNSHQFLIEKIVTNLNQTTLTSPSHLLIWFCYYFAASYKRPKSSMYKLRASVIVVVSWHGALVDTAFHRWRPSHSRSVGNIFAVTIFRKNQKD